MKKKRYLYVAALPVVFLLFTVSGCDNKSHMGRQAESTVRDSKSSVPAELVSQGTELMQGNGDSCYFDEKTGTLTFDGVGKCGRGGHDDGEEGFDFCVYDIKWRKKVDADKVKEVVIGDNITRIGYGAFVYMENLESVTIGNGVTTIQKFAFARCPKLKTVVIGNSVKKIPNKMFWRDSALESVVIGKSVQKVASYAFLDCSALKEIKLDRENPYLQEVEQGIYSADGKYLQLYPVAGEVQPVIADGTEKIMPEVFAHSKMKRIRIPASVRVLGGGVFHGCKQLEEVSFEKGSLCTKILPFMEGICEDYIGEYDKNFYGCFEDCISLKKISFPESLQKMDCDALVGCKSLKSVYFGREFQGIYTYYWSDGHTSDIWHANSGKLIFPNLQSIRISRENKKFMSWDGVLYSKDGTRLLHYPVSKKKTEYTVPDYVQIIDEYAFFHNKTLQKIDIGNVSIIGEEAFEESKRLSKVIMDEGVNMRFHAFAECYKLFSIRNLCRVNKVNDTALMDTRISLVDKEKKAYNPFMIKGRTVRLEVRETEQPVSWEALSGRKWVKIVKKYNNQGVAVKFLKARDYNMKVTIGTETVKFRILVRKNHSSPW